MTKSALLFLVYHEIAHIVRGYVDYLHELGFGILRDHPLDSAPNLEVRQVLENDADAVGIDFLLQVRSVDLFRGTKRQRKRQLRQTFAALAALFAVMDRPLLELTLEGPYAHPLHRLFNVLDCATPRIESELGVPGEDFAVIAKEVILETRKVAAFLGLPADRWIAPSANTWRLELHEQRKGETIRRMGELLKGRSTISDTILSRLRP